jgi:hypothetical protein
MDTIKTPDSSGSAFSRMFNVLAAPGEVFAEIKDRPVEHSNWLMPAVIWAVLGSVLAFLLFSQPWAISDLTKAQEKAIEKQVALGKMPQATADQAIDGLRRYMPAVMKIMGVVVTCIYAFALPFFWAAIMVFFVNTLFKGDVDYMKAAEAAGLASVIYLVGGVVATLVSFATGRLASFSPAFFLSDFDLSNRAHLALAALNPFYLWFLAVIAVAISVLGNVPMRKSLPACAAFWFSLRALFLSNQYTAGWVM